MWYKVTMTTKIISGTKTHIAQDGSTFNGCAKVSKMPTITGYHNGYFSFGTGATKALVDSGLDNLPVTEVRLDGDTLIIEFVPTGTNHPSKQFKGKCRLLHIASMSKYDLARRKWIITDIRNNTITAKERLQ